jgi:hypothetical protein
LGTFSRRDIPNVGVLQPRPGFQEGVNGALPILLRARFQVLRVFEALLVQDNRIAKRHFATRRRLNDFGSVIFPFKKVAQAEFCHRKPVGFQRLPNQLALQTDSGIIISRRCIADKICQWSRLPLSFLSRLCFAPFHANSIEKQYRKVKFGEAKT